MAQKFYTSEENFRILIALLKAHNIRKIIISPGATNITFAGSVQSDPFFELYSEIDERSAGYMACGMAEESGEPVVLSCTGATASRNYLAPMSEAFSRKLPVLAVTSSQHFGHIGSYIPQITDRRAPDDCAKFSIHIPMIHDAHDRWAYTVKMNEAILALTHNGGGPVHINMATEYSRDFSVEQLPTVQVIRRVDYGSEKMPDITAKTVGIFVGAHVKWSKELTELVDAFCEKYNAAVLCDHTSNYKGKYEVNPNLIPYTPRRNMDLLIHIGCVSGAYMSFNPREIWRVNPDGVVRDSFRRLSCVFQMREEDFFSHYVIHGGGGIRKFTEYYSAWRSDYDYVRSHVPELPFSNAWIAQHTINKLPEDSALHLGILNTLRTWNFFECPGSNLAVYCNTGGFGIDGCLSSLLGAAMASPDKLCFGVIGDLAFYYDIDALDCGHIGRNLRLIIINNGCGAEFKLYNHPAMRFGDDGDPFMAARGHFAREGRILLKHYAENLGFEYLSASNKEEYLACLDHFTTPETLDKPIFFEVFTEPEDESDALFRIHNINVDKLLPASLRVKRSVKKLAKTILRQKNVDRIKRLLGR